MPRPLTENLTGVLAQRTHRHARLWEIARRDGVVLRFTDHSSSLVYLEQTYTPAGAPEASAKRKEASLEAANRELRGAISSPAITIDDLRAGRYRGAAVTEYLVDSRFPWLGPIATDAYEITAVEWDREGWEAQIEGLGRMLSNDVGRVYTKGCAYKLGDSRCTVDLVPLSEFNVAIDSVDTAEPRRIFSTGSVLATPATGYFDLGEIIWQQGDSAGLTSEVRTHTRNSASSVTIELFLPLPFDITTADRFDISPGCNKAHGRTDPDGNCRNKFSNLVNYGGEPDIPGPDRALWTPPAG